MAPRHAFRADRAFCLGVEEELLLLEPGTRALRHGYSDLARAVGPVPAGEGTVQPDLYEGNAELATPICGDAEEATRALVALRGRLRDAGGVPAGAGLHPAAAFGDVVHVPGERYEAIVERLRGLVRRTVTCALHVHVGMPDFPMAIRVCDRLREHLPLLQALAGASPWWFGADSGLASARAVVFRSYPESSIPQPFGSPYEWARTVSAATRTADVADYTYLWWDLRPHPNLGTVEVRAMDAQAPPWAVAALAALVHALARRAADLAPVRDPTPDAALEWASFRAARDGLDTELWHDGRRRPAREVLELVLDEARPYAVGAALDEVRRFLVDGTGAERQRAAARGGGVEALLALLEEETAAPW